MSEVDFSDVVQSEAWFEEQAPRDRSKIINRAVLRVLANVSLVEAGEFEKVALPAIWASVIAAVRGRGRTVDMYLEDAAHTAAQNAAKSAIPADGKFDSAVCAAFAAASSAETVNSANRRKQSSVCIGAEASASGAMLAIESASMLGVDEATARALSLDAERLIQGKEFDAIWEETRPPIVLLENHRDFLKMLKTEGRPQFFHDWYLGMWEGTWTDWDLAHEVAKIDASVWEAGLKAVSQEIQEIEDRLISERLPQAEIIFESDDGLYDVKTAVQDVSSLTASVLKRVTFAFETAISSNSCDLNEMSFAAKLLRHALEECADDPNALEQYFREASDIIKSKIVEERYSDDEALIHLVSTLDELALQLRADHPEVAAASEARLKQTLREIDDNKRLEIAQSMEDMQEGTTGRLAIEYGIGAQALRQNEAAAAQASEIKRGAERGAKISMAERAKQAEGSGIMSAVKIGMRSNRLVELVMGLLSGGS